MGKRGKRIFIYLSGIIVFILFVAGIYFDRQISLFLLENQIGFLSEFMYWVSYFGTGFFVLVFMTSLFMWQEKKHEWIVPLWFSVIVSLILVYFLKLIFIRIRPYEFFNFVVMTPSLTSSFPSGHTAAVFSTLAVLDKEFPRFKWFWISFACLVAFSRLYLGMHYLTDVVFSGILAYGVGLLIVRIKSRIEKNNKKEKKIIC